MSFVHDAPPMMPYRQNKSPFAIALGDWFPFRTYFLTGKASPNDRGIIVTVIIIVIGEAQLVSHGDGIIAQFHALAISFENQIHPSWLEMLAKKIYPLAVVQICKRQELSYEVA